MFHNLLIKNPEYKITKDQAKKLDGLYDELNKKQKDYVFAILQGLSPAEAKKQAGYSRNAPEKHAKPLKKYLDTLEGFKAKLILTEKQKYIDKIKDDIRKIDNLMDQVPIDPSTIGTHSLLKLKQIKLDLMKEQAKVMGLYAEQEIQKEALGKPPAGLIEALAKITRT